MVRRDFVESARADQDEDDNILSEDEDEHGRVKYQERTGRMHRNHDA